MVLSDADVHSLEIFRHVHILYLMYPVIYILLLGSLYRQITATQCHVCKPATHNLTDIFWCPPIPTEEHLLQHRVIQHLVMPVSMGFNEYHLNRNTFYLYDMSIINDNIILKRDVMAWPCCMACTPEIYHKIMTNT